MEFIEEFLFQRVVIISRWSLPRNGNSKLEHGKINTRDIPKRSTDLKTLIFYFLNSSQRKISPRSKGFVWFNLIFDYFAGRGKKKKRGLLKVVFMMAAAAKATLLYAMIHAVALVAGKALVVAKVALALAAAVALKKALGTKFLQLFISAKTLIELMAIT